MIPAFLQSQYLLQTQRSTDLTPRGADERRGMEMSAPFDKATVSGLI